MDIGTGLALLGNAKLLEKMLGPTAEYIGGGIKNWTERRVNNVSKIFTIAKEKLGDRIEEPGSIPPRVLKEILDEGSFSDDSLTAEYFGGVLASSRSQISRDDRGTYWATLVARLSAYQIRTHFLVYRGIYDRFRGKNFYFNSEDRKILSVLLQLASYNHSMEFTKDEEEQFIALLSHSFFGLNKEGLIGDFAYGAPEALKKILGEDYNPPERGGIWVTPSAPGVELFLWAHGQGNLKPSDLLNLNLTIPDGILPCAVVLNEDDLKAKKPE
jgi:hypothetical protein